jgi:3-hydroxyacyl-[acyl-carrier-protein] dehydratase
METAVDGYLDLTLATAGTAPSGQLVQLRLPSEDPVFAGHYPDYPVLPASLVVELCCAVLNTYKAIDPLLDGWRLTTSRITGAIRPGDLVTVHVAERDDGIDLRVHARQSLAAELSFRPSTGASAVPRTGDDPAPTAFRPASGFLPQRYPLMVVDQVAITPDGQSGRARKLLSYGDYAFRRFSPERNGRDEPAYPVGGVIEGIEQAAAAVLSQRWDMADPDHVILVGGLRDLDFHGQAYPGEIIDFATAITMLTDRMAILSGTARVDARPLASIGRISVIRMERQ